jgi:hypothetical protein
MIRCCSFQAVKGKPGAGEKLVLPGDLTIREASVFDRRKGLALFALVQLRKFRH